MIKINLLPTKAARKKESVIQQMVVGVVVFAVYMIGLYLINGQKQQEVVAQRAENSRLQEEINQLQSIISQVEEYKKRKADRNSKIEIIRKLNDGRSGPVKMMEEFTYTLPDRLWIDNFREKSRRLEVSGTAVNGAVIADFLDNLKNSKYFSDIELQQTTLLEKDDQPYQQFRVTMAVNYTPE